MAENKKGFFKRQSDKAKNAGKELIESSADDSIISFIVAVYQIIVTALKTFGERFGLWLGDKEKKLKEKQEKEQD